MNNQKRMNKYFKYTLPIFLFFFVFSAKAAFAFTCTAVAGGGNWNAAGTWTGSCNSTIPQAGDDVVLNGTSGNVVVNVATNSLKSFTMTGYTGTLSGTANITVRGATASTNNIIFDGTITWTGLLRPQMTTSTATLNLTTNGKLLTGVSINGNASAFLVLQDNLTFTAAKTDQLLIDAGGLDLNGKTISGSSDTNRVQILSGTAGTSATVTINGGTFAYADFTDINLSANTDLSAITGGSGDCGGNTNITFTTPVTRYWVGDSGNWDSTGEWSTSSGGSSGASIPICQDSVVFDDGSFSGAGQTVTTNGVPRLARNIDWSAYSEGQSPNWTLNAAGGQAIYGSLNMARAGLSVIGTYSQTSTLTFRGRDPSYTLTTGGESIGGSLILTAPTGTLTLNDALTISTTGLTVNFGTFDANDFNVTTLVFTQTNSANAVVNAGNGTWTVNSTGTVWSMGASSVFNAEGSTIFVSNTTATSKTFAGGGKTYNNITFSGDNIVVTGSNTFAAFAVNNGANATAGGLRITSGTTQTVTSFTTTGTVGSVASTSAVTASSPAIISDSSGTNCVDYIKIKDITVTGGAVWLAGVNAVDNGGNTGWRFNAVCPNTTPNTGTHTGTANEKVRGGVNVRGGAKFR